jgi:hypothetical protein
MTLVEAVETLREFRKLTLGPDLSLAIDTVCNAIDALIESDRMYRERGMRVVDRGSSGAIAGGAADEVLMNAAVASYISDEYGCTFGLPLEHIEPPAGLYSA